MKVDSSGIGSHRRLRALRCLLIAFTLAAIAWPVSPASAKKRRRAQKKEAPPAAVDPGPVAEELFGGTHWRAITDHGPVHLFRPKGYEPSTASTVVYIHGYYTKVDRAVEEHRLLEQFAATGTNALFVIPEAPSGLRDTVSWWSLGELLRQARLITGLARPWGQLVVVGHSGAYRTMLAWLDYPAIDVLILVDAMYGEESSYASWFREADHRRLINIGGDTFRWTEDFVREVAPALVLDRIPERPQDVSPEVQAARHVYLRSHLGHMDLVTYGGALPSLLRIAKIPLATLSSPP